MTQTPENSQDDSGNSLPATIRYDDLKAALPQLEAMKGRGVDDTGRPDRLPVKAVEQLPEVFQVRAADNLELHVNGLVSVLKQGQELDPVTVWRCGKHAFLVDGHHRMDAYQRRQAATGQSVEVPVEWFEGTARDALKRASQDNVKTRLPMTTKQRNDLAWRLVKLGVFSKAETAKMAGVSERHVADMRRVAKELGEDADTADTWFWAKFKTRPADDLDPDEREAWKETVAQDYAERLGKAFGHKLQDNPELAAMALGIYFGRKAHEVIAFWRDEADYMTPEEREAFDF